jgi:leucyl/phenylalanyl-tRNA--protein transferase
MSSSGDETSQEQEFVLTPETLLNAYACGVFPMADSADDPALYWVQPEERGIFPLDRFYIPKSLAKAVRRDDYSLRINTAFKQVVEACASGVGARSTTWINERIKALYFELHKMGHCHSVEVWRDDQLIGGLYGVSLGGVFCGESMFHTQTNASKIALVHLVARLKAGGFTLLDAQFITPHLASLGAIEVSAYRYEELLQKALEVDADFHQLEEGTPGSVALQLISQTS